MKLHRTQGEASCRDVPSACFDDKLSSRARAFGCTGRREHAAGRSAAQRPNDPAICYVRRPGDTLSAALGQDQGRRQVCGCLIGFDKPQDAQAPSGFAAVPLSRTYVMVEAAAHFTQSLCPCVGTLLHIVTE